MSDRLQKGEVAAEIDMRLSQAKESALAAELVGARENLAIIEKLVHNLFEHKCICMGEFEKFTAGFGKRLSGSALFRNTFKIAEFGH